MIATTRTTLIELLTILHAAPLLADTKSADELIPFAAMTESNRALVRGVTDHYTLRREYGAREFHARVEQFTWLMDHIEACSVLAQSLGYIRYRAARDDKGRVFADNREGASGFLMQVAATDSKRAYFVEGSQRGLLTVRGRGVAVVDFAQTNADTIEYTGALFVKVDNIVLAALAQLFSVFVHRTVDHHFEHLLKHPIAVSTMAMTNTPALLERIEAVPSEERALVKPFAELLRRQTNAAGAAR